ncbi:MAG: 50S ribosomal protein L23 [bacterium]
MKKNRIKIIEPILTEKLSDLQEKENKYGFVVDKNANKIEIKKAVEDKFEVKVEKVTTMNMKGKLKKLGRFEGKRASWKKAIVTLAENDKIDFIEGS